MNKDGVIAGQFEKSSEKCAVCGKAVAGGAGHVWIQKNT